MNENERSCIIIDIAVTIDIRVSKKKEGKNRDTRKKINQKNVED